MLNTYIYIHVSTFHCVAASGIAYCHSDPFTVYNYVYMNMYMYMSLYASRVSLISLQATS